MNKWSIIVAVIAFVIAAGCIDGPPYVVVEDMNNDGLPDMVITTYGTEGDENTISIFFGGTKESFAREIYKGSIEENTTMVADFNGDRIMDIAFLPSLIEDLSPSWKVLYGKGDGFFEEARGISISDMRIFLSTKPD